MKITIHISDETKPEVAVETGRGGAVYLESVDRLEGLARQLKASPPDDTPTFAVAAELMEIAERIRIHHACQSH